MASDRQRLLETFYRNRRLAHAELFAHRHKNLDPEFHGELIDGLHSAEQNECYMSFRGSAKSTMAEEAVIIQIGYREINNGLILGASLPLAMQRLHAIRREIEKNAKLRAVFGDLRGQPWTDDKLEFSNGASLTAMGKGQALRGSKDEIFRPDFVLADDIEDRESVRTSDGREKIQSWFLGEVLPAMDPTGRCRVLANMLDAECLAEKLKSPDSGFRVRIYPIEYRDLTTGERRAMWPDRGIPGVKGVGLEAIDNKRKQMFALGRAKEFMMEYMCQAMAGRERPFRNDMRRVEPRQRLWEAVYVMVDPARTTGEQSATTGFAVWSWIGPRLVVWELSAKKLMPSEIVAEMFRLQDMYRPVKMGFEADGLNEWALQPIRQEQVRRGVMMPLVPVKAPAGKIDFIKALQIYFTAREVYFTQEFQEGWAQFLSFPAGLMDAPNALAYALHPKMKAGVPIYEDFNVRNVVDEIEIDRQRPVWLALNATGAVTTAVLLQVIDDGMRIYADWVREQDAGSSLAGILREANLEAGKLVRPTAGPLHYDRYNNVGLVAAGRRLQLDLRRGSEEDRGRSELRAMLRRQTRGMPSLLCSAQARWTLNAFAGGYCRAVLKGGVMADVAEDGNYRTLIEGVEAFAGLLSTGATSDEDDGRLNAVTKTGQRYHSALP